MECQAPPFGREFQPFPGELRAEEIAWAAGFIDGEGSLGAGRGKGVSLEVGQVSREPLDELARIFGGSIYERPRRHVRGGTFYRWTLAGAPQVVAALCLLHPYLRVKRREAEILIAIAATFGPRGYSTWPEVKLLRSQLETNLKEERSLLQTST